jgi:hypothetical protein
VVMVILGFMVWRFATGNYFYPGLGIAILLSIGIIFFTYRTNATSSNVASRDNKQARRKRNGKIEDKLASSKNPEQTRITDITDSSASLRGKPMTSLKDIKAKPNATEVASRYYMMAKMANETDNETKSKPLFDSFPSHDQQKPANTLVDDAAEAVKPILDSENTQPPLPLIEDQSSLTAESQNELVNAVWCHCENPYCKYSHFLSVHPIIDEKDEGTNKLENLIVLCPYCHDLAHRHEIPEKEMRSWISNREDRLKFKPEWRY